MPKTTVASFVLRFTQETASDVDLVTPWRAVIRHVQSDQEAHFTQMEQALAFIGQYVDLADGTVRQDEGSEEERKGR
ncbi:MAG: hypothetical protein KGY78_02665 [Anaerolineae bacterium]|nr:hypothetical protein [Anaerolineae bacterium]